MGVGHYCCCAKSSHINMNLLHCVLAAGNYPKNSACTWRMSFLTSTSHSLAFGWNMMEHTLTWSRGVYKPQLGGAGKCSFHSSSKVLAHRPQHPSSGGSWEHQNGPGRAPRCGPRRMASVNHGLCQDVSTDMPVFELCTSKRPKGRSHPLMGLQE